MTVRRIEAIRDRIMGMCGTTEALVTDDYPSRVTMQWRKPLSIDEVNRMAPTAEVRMRPDRP